MATWSLLSVLTLLVEVTLFSVSWAGAVWAIHHLIYVWVASIRSPVEGLRSARAIANIALISLLFELGRVLQLEHARRNADPCERYFEELGVSILWRANPLRVILSLILELLLLITNSLGLGLGSGLRHFLAELPLMAQIPALIVAACLAMFALACYFGYEFRLMPLLSLRVGPPAYGRNLDSRPAANPGRLGSPASARKAVRDSPRGQEARSWLSKKSPFR